MWEMGDKFIAIHETLDLGARNLDFESGYVHQDRSCGTVACHGGWGAVIFGIKPDHDGLRRFGSGAGAISRFIGLDGAYDFERWAGENPVLWGNAQGGKLFDPSGYRAFDFYFNYKCTLKVIGNHYIAVAKRIRESEEEHNDGES